MDFIGPDECDIISKPLYLGKKLLLESQDQKVIDKIINTYSIATKTNKKCKKVRKKPYFRIPRMKLYDCDYLSSSNGKLYGINIKPYGCDGFPNTHHDVERGYDHYFHLYDNKPITNMYGTKVKFCIKVIENRENDDFYDEVCWNNNIYDYSYEFDIILKRIMSRLV